MKINTLKKQFNNDYADLPKHWLEDWLLHIIDKPANFLLTHGNYQLTDSQQQQFITGIEQMREGTPVAYLIGSQAFWELDFYVNEHTLIPRPDTEILVENVLNWIDNNQDNFDKKLPYQLLDLGTGSGCIALSLADELEEEWQITAVDISEQALQITEQNIKRHHLKNVSTLHSSWFDNIPHDNKYHIIVSNPPYIDKSDEHLTKLSKEPITALVADNKGMADIEQIVSGVVDYLYQGGLLAIEHGYDQGLMVRECFTKNGFRDVQTIQDYGSNDRVTMGVFNCNPL